MIKIETILSINLWMGLLYLASTFILYTWLFFYRIKADVNTFQFKLWLIVIIGTIEFTTHTILKQIKLETALVECTLLVAYGYSYLLTHWMFAWQYYTSSVQIQVMLWLIPEDKQRLTRNQRLNYLAHALIALGSATVWFTTYRLIKDPTKNILEETKSLLEFECIY